MGTIVQLEVEAFVDYLVSPMFPLKHNDVVEETPSESQQKSVAKQLHAAVVLYNYYYLKQYPEKEFLKFDQFCNLAIKFKPSIQQYMGYMTRPNRPNLNDPGNQLSICEKAVMDACTISETLREASSNISKLIKEWPVTKVAVFLIDSKNENCFLLFDNGLWSVIEKDLYFEESGLGSESKKVSLMRNYDEDGLKEVAFSAVKEVAGTDSKLKVLEDHVVYSLSQAKAATHFYIVQSTPSIKKGFISVPIKHAINRLQGSHMMKKCSGNWITTRVVEYYHLFPYAEIISKWFSRSNGLIQMEEGTADSNIVQGSHKSFKKGGGQNKQVFYNNLQITSKLDSKSSSSNNNRVAKIRNTFNKDTPAENSNGKTISDCSKQKDVNGSCGLESNDSLSEGNNSKGIDKPLVCLHKGNQKAKMHTPLNVYPHEKMTPTNAISIKDNVNNMPIINDKRVDGEKKSDEDRNGMLVEMEC